MDDEAIGWCALATRAACSRMTAQHLHLLHFMGRLSRSSEPGGIAV